MAPLLAKKGKRLGKLLLYAFFGPFGGREIGKSLRIVKVWTKQLKVIFYIYFRIGLRLYIGDDYMSLLDFVDWLGSP